MEVGEDMAGMGEEEVVMVVGAEDMEEMEELAQVEEEDMVGMAVVGLLRVEEGEAMEMEEMQMVIVEHMGEEVLQALVVEAVEVTVFV